jgi:hypothetical protein
MHTNIVNLLKDQSPLSDLYSRSGFLVRRANQILMGIAEQECAKIGLTPPQHVCLSALHRCDTLDQISLGTDRRFNRMRPSIAPRKRHQAG